MRKTRHRRRSRRRRSRIMRGGNIFTAGLNRITSLFGPKKPEEESVPVPVEEQSSVAEQLPTEPGMDGEKRRRRRRKSKKRGGGCGCAVPMSGGKRKRRRRRTHKKKLKSRRRRR